MIHRSQSNVASTIPGLARGGRLILILARLLWLGLGYSGVAAAHPLGFGNVEMEVRPGRIHGEMVLDVPQQVLVQGQGQRRTNLMQQVSDGFRVFAEGRRLKLSFRVLALGDGANAVDVLRFSSSSLAEPAPRYLELDTSESLGALAVTLHSYAANAATRDRAQQAAARPRVSVSKVLRPAGERQAFPLQAVPKAPSHPTAAGEAIPPPLEPASPASATTRQPERSTAGQFTWYALVSVAGAVGGFWAFAARRRQRSR